MIVISAVFLYWYCPFVGTKTVWEKEIAGEYYVKGVIIGDKLITGSYFGSLEAFDIYSGDSLWINEEVTKITAINAYDHRILVSSGYIMYCVDVNGNILWDAKTKVYASNPLASDGIHVYTGYESFNLADGEKLWDIKSDTSGGPLDRFENAFLISDVGVSYADGVFYASNAWGQLCAVEANTGDINWVRRLVNTPIPSHPPDEYKFPAPSVYNGMVFATFCANGLYAVDAINGKILWHAFLDEYIVAAPRISNDELFIASGCGKVYRVNPNNGVYDIIYNTPNAIYSDVISNANYIIISDVNGFNYLYNRARNRIDMRKATGYCVTSTLVKDRNIVYLAGSEISVVRWKKGLPENTSY